MYPIFKSIYIYRCDSFSAGLSLRPPASSAGLFFGAPGKAGKSMATATSTADRMGKA